MAAALALRDRWVGPGIAGCPAGHGPDPASDPASLIALLATAGDAAWSDAGVSTREVVATLLGAIGTSTALIVHAVDELLAWLAGHPGDRARALDLDFLASVVQETVRVHPSLPHFLREATQDMELASSARRVRGGQRVAVSMRAANLDEGVFGADAREFNPYRALPPSVPRYGLGFGAGQHQCIGLRVVVGADGVGSHTHVLRAYVAAGIGPDPDRVPELEPGDIRAFRTYPLAFSALDTPGA